VIITKKRKVMTLHPSLKLEYLKNKHFKYTGLDTLLRCKNKIHFLRYNKQLDYNYNSRGYRGKNWPEYSNLTQCIWCVGDSFTAGMGQPESERWSSLLENKLMNETINISLHGASNDWIERISNYIVNHISPDILVIQWTYIFRRELSNPLLSDEKRRIHSVKKSLLSDSNHYENFFKCLLSIEENKRNTKIIHTFIPNWCNTLSEKNIIWDMFINKNNISPLLVMNSEQLDYARDYHHYDVKTASRYANDILKLI
jgi:hypothetical protein